MILNNNDFIIILMKKKIEILKLHSTIAEMKNLLKKYNNGLAGRKTTNELEHRLREIIQTEEQKNPKN